MLEIRGQNQNSAKILRDIWFRDLLGGPVVKSQPAITRHGFDLLLGMIPWSG